VTNTVSNASSKTSIHILLQGKGGVGKSLISSILSQYLLSKGQDVRCVDADPVNQTLSEYQGLAVSCLNLFKRETPGESNLFAALVAVRGPGQEPAVSSEVTSSTSGGALSNFPLSLATKICLLWYYTYSSILHRGCQSCP
jgi:Mrp family chromosome partitioning ATPase